MQHKKSKILFICAYNFLHIIHSKSRKLTKIHLLHLVSFQLPLKNEIPLIPTNKFHSPHFRIILSCSHHPISTYFHSFPYPQRIHIRISYTRRNEGTRNHETEKHDAPKNLDRRLSTVGNRCKSKRSNREAQRYKSLFPPARGIHCSTACSLSLSLSREFETNSAPLQLLQNNARRGRRRRRN